MTFEPQAFPATALPLGAAPAPAPSAAELEDQRLELARGLSRLSAGFGLAALYGLALGARAGGGELLRHALGAPIGLVVVAGVATPSLFVVLALLNAPITPAQMLASVARGVGAAGLVLAGLAPAAALLVVSIAAPGAAALVAGLGLALAGGIGLLNMLAALRERLALADFTLRSKAHLALLGFALLALALSTRAWSTLLPILGGAA